MLHIRMYVSIYTNLEDLLLKRGLAMLHYTHVYLIINNVKIFMHLISVS